MCSTVPEDAPASEAALARCNETSLVSRSAAALAEARFSFSFFFFFFFGKSDTFASWVSLPAVYKACNHVATRDARQGQEGACCHHDLLMKCFPPQFDVLDLTQDELLDFAQFSYECSVKHLNSHVLLSARGFIMHIRHGSRQGEV